MRRTERWAKTIVFCVDQEHAAVMRQALTNLNQDLVAKYPHYVERVTPDEGETGRGFLSNFPDPEQSTPVILTTSQMLTTGVDVTTCKNVVLVRVINGLTEFKQIIGHVVYELDGEGQQLRLIQYTDYTAAQLRTLFRTADALSADWADPVTRETLLARLELIGIRFADLAEANGTPDADPLDLLCHLAFQRLLRARRERAASAPSTCARNRTHFFDQYSAAARGILDTLLEQPGALGLALLPADHRAGTAALLPPRASSQLGDFQSHRGGGSSAVPVSCLRARSRAGAARRLAMEAGESARPRKRRSAARHLAVRG
jgi:hypothetical protein